MVERRRNRGRAVHGILLMDKPSGINSNAALQRVKRLFRARKAGHTGSLDPLADGLLPICLGEATKMSGFLLEADKYYRVLIRLGVTTSTGDADGRIIEERPVGNVDEGLLKGVLADLRGPIEQTPPMFSALKIKGQPLYKLAYQGVEIERKPRRIVIHELTVRRIEGALLELDVHCSKGTYIRTLAEDIGNQLGCGGHVAKLRRLGVGPFNEDQMISLETMERFASKGLHNLDTLLLPMETALKSWPDIRISSDMAYFLQRGQAVLVPHAPSQGLVKLFTGESRFLGVGHILDDGRVAPRRLVKT